MKFLFILCLLAGCGTEWSSILKESINDINNPDNIPGADSELERHLPSLPKSGSSSISAWGGSEWYPYSQNGTATTKYGNPSALTKYDMVAGTKANQWELDTAQWVGKTGWAGHCNGTSAAGTMSKEPMKDVEYRGVHFTRQDIKTLLVEMWSGGGYAVGGRCNNKQIKYDQYGRLTEQECRDLNAGTFHIVLANFLGVFKKPVIADQDPGEQVWNYPIIGYQVIEEREVKAEEANRILTVANGVVYPFNPNAKYFMYFRTAVQYSNRGLSYEYILEGDENGYIIGGEWVGQNKTFHPDFLWRHNSPTPENPYINTGIVGDIHRWSF